MKKVTSHKWGTPHRWKATYEPNDILQVLSYEPQKTSTIQKKLSEIDSRYEKVSRQWFRVALGKLENAEKVVKIKKEDEIADYWILK